MILDVFLFQVISSNYLKSILLFPVPVCRVIPFPSLRSTLAGAGLSGSFRPELLLVRHGGVPTPECSDDGVVPGIEKRTTHLE